MSSSSSSVSSSSTTNVDKNSPVNTCTEINSLCMLTKEGLLRSEEPFTANTSLLPNDVQTTIAKSSSKFELTPSSYCWSTDGSVFIISLEYCVRVFRMSENGRLEASAYSLLESGVQYLGLSPQANWLTTWRRPLPNNGNDANVAVWCTRSGRCMLRRRRKELQLLDCGPPMQYSANDESVWILQGSELLGFDLIADETDAATPSDNVSDDTLYQYKWRLHVPGMTRFWLSCGYQLRIIVLIRGAKGAPSRIAMYNINALSVQDELCSKSIGFNSDDVSVKWNTPGNAVLVQASAEHDATGASYYGAASLYLLSCDPNISPATVCSARSDGIVHDAQWNPQIIRKEFAVICGRRAFICNVKTCQAIVDFGTQGWNHINFSPSGRFLMLGGFGNFPGNMWFFDRHEKLLLGTASDHGCKPLGWSSDGRSLLTARMRPTRRVDNGFRIYKYSGETKCDFKTDILFNVSFIGRPISQSLDMQRQRAASVSVLNKAKPITASSLAEKKIAAYRPPMARRAEGNKYSSEAVSAQLNRIRDERHRTPRALASISIDRKSSIVADTPAANAESKRIQKSVKRKEKKIRKAAVERERIAQEELVAKNERQRKINEDEAEREQARRDAFGPDATPETVSKRIKQLLKKLRQIDVLKDKHNGGMELSAEEAVKIAKETELRAEIQALRRC